jgi:hypothetical protein
MVVPAVSQVSFGGMADYWLAPATESGRGFAGAGPALVRMVSDQSANRLANTPVPPRRP